MDHHDHPHTIVAIVKTGEFHGGPLDGAGFFFQVPDESALTDLRVTVPRRDGHRDLYLYDQQPDPANLEAGLRWIGVVGGP